ncbi:MAG TPA: tRNA uridine-5-carboxymethylaminomethyl(34) synthesis GTPase MnmE, partial [Acidobacteria bacterium]|nr:tRNA uridine-5-carboxymethylaminomethyl(34) synthesis GTPase MnmE [Acidobacteriota bacterium]
MFNTDDTIVAIATPPGRGGIGVVRLSGPNAQSIAGALLSRRAGLKARTATLATLTRAAGDDDAEQIDQVLATFFPGPASYTGDDVVELSAHGSPVVLEAIVEAAMRSGARLAEPGEFTFRGFLNGRIDLVQAEAVADLVDSVTPLQARLAYDQLEGTLSTEIRAIDTTLFDLIASLEASLDFPEEGYHFVDRQKTVTAIADISARISGLLAGGRRGRVIREGRQVVIIGSPNTGKSSIFNGLVGAGRAIVTAVAGTTRDLVTETIDVRGVPVRLVDTAGIRETGDAVEVEGVLRARSALAVADLSLLVFDRSRPFDSSDVQLLTETSSCRRLLIVNKVDLPLVWASNPFTAVSSRIVEASATTEGGLEALREALTVELAAEEPRRDSPAITNTRHLDLLERARIEVERAGQAVSREVSEEFVLADLQQARAILEEITGQRTTEDLLQHIFSRFCIG